MNGYDYQQHGPGDNRQPPSIPSITSLQIERPLSSASPNPSQLPPLNQSFPSGATFLPPLSNRADPIGAQNHHPNQTPFISEKASNLSNIAPPQAFGSHPFNPYAPQSYPQAFHLPPNYTNGDANHTTAHNYPGPSTQLPPYIETSHHDQRNLLPPFNPQPSQQQQQLQNGPDARLPDQRPMPVVGSQGRRGVLPSAPGRPSVTPGMEIRGHPANNVVKGADGKYPCPFCSKVYLHLKHLKRHHLRHTGERPYQCSLCKETFCRSDILKRHFQKCSIRRGNPTGATHLTHAQAHLGRGSQTPTAPGAASGMPQTNGVAGQSAPPSSYRHNWPNGSLQTQAGQDPGSARSSRSSSIARRPGSSADDRKSFVSTIGTAPQTGQTSLNPSPSSSGGEERKYNAHEHAVGRDGPPTHYHEQQAQQHHPGQAQPPPQYPAYYGSAPQQFASGSGPETYPGFGYGQTNGYQYPPHPEPARYPEQWNHYQQFFQPGSQDPVMSYQQ